MAIKPATIKNADGEIIHLKTGVAQVAGLPEALSAKQDQLTQQQLDAVNSGATSEAIGKIASNESSINGINALIPGQASESNQLADKDFVNSSVQTMSASAIFYNAASDPFPTWADLDSATVFYNGGREKTPDENDYCTVLADEKYEGAQTRYSFSDGEWGFQFLVNDTPFTAVQNAAINSGVTAGKVAEYDALVDNKDSYLKKAEATQEYAKKEYVEGLGTVRFVPNGADLSGFGGNDLIIEYDDEE